MKLHALILLLGWGLMQGSKTQVRDAAYFIKKQSYRYPVKNTACSCVEDKKQNWCCDGRQFGSKCGAVCALGQGVQCVAGPCKCSCSDECDPWCCHGSVQYRNDCQMLCGEGQDALEVKCRRGLCKKPNRSAFPITYDCSNLYP